MTENEAIWSLSDAKSRLDEVIDRAISDGPQTIDRPGQEAVVLVSLKQWERATVRDGTLADFFARSPLRGSGIVIERLKDDFRPIDL